MSRRNRGDAFAVVTVAGALASVALFGLFLWDMSQSQAENRVRAEGYSAQYAEETQKRITDACTVAATMAECAADIVAAQHEEQRSEGDLAAQRDMAKYALAMVVVTLASIIIGVVGVYFVWRTLGATRKANKIARKSAERQLRAYVQISKIKIGLVRGQTGVTAVGVGMKNTGQTPAEIFEYGWGVVPGEYDHEWERPKFDIEPHISTLGVGQKTTLFRAISVEDVEHQVLYVFGTIRYRDVFKNVRKVEFTRMLIRPDVPGWDWDTRQVRRGPNYSE